MRKSDGRGNSQQITNQRGGETYCRFGLQFRKGGKKLAQCALRDYILTAAQNVSAERQKLVEGMI